MSDKKKWNFSDEKDFKEATERIKASYKNLTGQTQGADDCAQEVIEQYLSGKSAKQTVDQAVIDYLRRDSGRKGETSYTLRQNLRQGQSIDEPVFKNLSVGSVSQSLEDRLEVSRIIGMSHHWERAVMHLTFVEGYGQAEIGHFFGVSESRVSQWLARIQKRICKRMEAQEQRQRAREVQEVLSQKTERIEWSMVPFSSEGLEIGESW